MRCVSAVPVPRGALLEAHPGPRNSQLGAGDGQGDGQGGHGHGHRSFQPRPAEHGPAAPQNTPAGPQRTPHTPGRVSIPWRLPRGLPALPSHHPALGKHLPQLWERQEEQLCPGPGGLRVWGTLIHPRRSQREFKGLRKSPLQVYKSFYLLLVRPRMGQ